MGLKEPTTEETPDAYGQYYRQIMDRTAGLPLVLVLSAEAIEFHRMVGLPQ